MRKILELSVIAGIIVSLVSCVSQDLAFDVDTEAISIGAEGGVQTIKVSTTDNWIATTQDPWITISPANGIGSAECKVIVDSTLYFNSRKGNVQIRELATDKYLEFTVSQDGFEHSISLKKNTVELPDFAVSTERSFDVVVSSNVEFDVDSPGWLKTSKDKLVLDREARPRNVTVHFEWNINTTPEEKVAKVQFKPRGGVEARADVLTVKQKAAQEIEIGVAGDSLALLAISRNMNCWVGFDTSQQMKFWSNVDVWDEYDENYAEANEKHLEQYGKKIDGRVRYAQFNFFVTKEGLPYEVQYLTAAEDLVFFGNANTFLLYDLTPGEYICKLENLKRLTIAAYGLTDLPAEFVNLKSLESLNIGSNNFQKIPSVLTPENFPNLKTLILLNAERHVIGNLKINYKEDCGGLIDEPDWVGRLLTWEALDTLRLSVNYLQGELPTLEGDPRFPVWSDSEVAACDTLPSALAGTPKVLPHTRLFSINLNRFHGNIPDWLLYHPALDQWFPESLVFPQDGVDREGNQAKFDNEPVSLEYYYKFYEGCKENPYLGDEEE